jgi:hypothetical protein
MSLTDDFATCTERSEGPVTRRGSMFETRRSYAPLGVHGLSFLVETERGGRGAGAWRCASSSPRTAAVGSDHVFDAERR